MENQQLRYHLAESTIDAEDLGALADWLRGNPWLTQGPLVREFENRWAQWLGRRHAVYVNSGSSANLLMYYALLVAGRLKNRRVIVPAISWATTVAPAVQLGFEPVMCDADAENFGIAIPDLEKLIRDEDPGAVILVHTLGIPNAMEQITALKARYGFALMEDSCAATGSRYQRRLVGTFGELASFSLYFGHHLSTIEGGMVVTDDSQLYDILLHLRSHGWAKDLDPAKEAVLAAKRDVIEFNRRFTFYYPGFNVRSTDLNAFLGLRQLDRIDWVLERRIANHNLYCERFRQSPDFFVPGNPDAKVCSISFVALAQSREHRERVGLALAANGIETRPLGGGSMGRQPFWVDRYGQRSFPVADRLHETSFMLPNHPYLTPADIHAICDVVLAVPASATEQGATR